MGGDATADGAPLDADERRHLRAIADYQFGPGAGAALFANDGRLEVLYSRSGRPDRVYAPAGRLVTLTTDGRFTLGFAGGRRLHGTTTTPVHRVVMDAEAVPFVADGHNAFAKFVRRVDPHLRPRDEALLVDGDDRLLAVGRAELSAAAMVDLQRGVAVDMREGREDADAPT